MQLGGAVGQKIRLRRSGRRSPRYERQARPRTARIPPHTHLSISIPEDAVLRPGLEVPGAELGENR